MFPHETPAAAALVRQCLGYNSRTGLLFWLVRRGRARAGDLAGNIGTNGHRRVGLLGRYFQAHRIVWVLTHGTWPEGLIDHENRDGLNNQPGNLRPADKSLNAQNSMVRSDSRTGLRGVGWSKVMGQYRARICLNGKRVILGYFDDPLEAALVYETARYALHPYAPRRKPE